MGKQPSPPKKAEGSQGKGQVSPLQIAFIVDRYLADNGFAATLASFHSEAAEIFAKARTKEAPKGLLPLAEILDEYVSLKEQRIIVEHEKRRVEVLLQGIHGAVQAYRSADGAALAPVPAPPSQPSPSLPTTPAPPLTPAVAAAALIDAVVPANPTNRSSPTPGPSAQNAPVLRSSPPVVPNDDLQSKARTSAAAETTSKNKRKNGKLVLKAPAAPKKQRGQPAAPKKRGQPQTEMPTTEGTQGLSQSAVGNSTGAATSGIHQSTNVPIDGSSTSPKTPPHAQTPQATVPTNPPISRSASANAYRDLTPTKCSIIASKTVVVSPFRNEGYYAVEKSCYISSSPLKPNSKINGGKRDRVKSRLDFNDVDVTCSERPAAPGSVISATDDKVVDDFDFDLPDIDMDFSIAELLVDFDLDELTTSNLPIIKPLSVSIPGLECECLEGGPAVPDPSLSIMPGVVSEKGITDLEGYADHGSVTSVKTITKRIKISSPVKGKRDSCCELPGIRTVA